MAEAIAPEAARLLAEVVADPCSTLLGRDAGTPAVTDEAPRSPLATGLTPPERELLAVWRDEAAYLLRRLVHEDLVRGGAAATAGRVLSGPREPRDELPREAGAARIESLLEGLGEGAPSLGAPGTIGGRLRARPADRLWLASASLRLAPTTTGRAYVANELMLRGQGRAATRIHRRLLAGPADARLRTHSLGALAQLHGGRGEHGEALRAACLAARLSPWDPAAARGWLLHAAQLGDGRELLEAAAHLDEASAAPDRAGAAWLGAVAAQRLSAGLLTSIGRRAVERALDHVPDAPRTLLTTLLQLDDSKR